MSTTTLWRQQAHNYLRAGVPGWPSTLDEANADPSAVLTERVLAKHLEAAHHARTHRRPVVQAPVPPLQHQAAPLPVPRTPPMFTRRDAAAGERADD